MRFYVGDLLRAPVGAHLDFEINTGFQDLADDLSVESMRGKLTFLHTDKGVLVYGKLAVDIEAECVRCLEPVKKSIIIEMEEAFRPLSTMTPRVQAVPIDVDGYIHLKPTLRDLVIVSTPMHLLCRPDCKGLCPNCGQNLNKAPCSCLPEEFDPRMAALKLLLLKQDREQHE